MSDYLEIRTTIPDDAEDELAQALSSWPILGVDLVPQDAGRIDVGIWIPSGDDRLVHQILSLITAFSSDTVRLKEHLAEDWSAQWR
ncbi:MAG: hypothetical protein E4H44_02445, partial [Candidatus Aminicenantes bacterium]